MAGTNEAITGRLEAIAEDSRALRRLAQELAQEIERCSPDGLAAQRMLEQASQLEEAHPEDASYLRARAAEILA